MKMIHFEGYLSAPENDTLAEELEDKLLDLITGNFDHELETMSCQIVEVEESGRWIKIHSNKS